MMCDERLWRFQCAALSGKCKVADLSEGECVQNIAAEILSSAPARFALAGLSMGGIVAFEMWRQAPERIERLALLDTNFRADPPERQRLRSAQIARVEGGRLESVLRDELKPNYLAAAHRGNSQLLDEVLAMGLELGSEVFTRQSLALRNRPDSSDTLATIDCPVLVLCGDEDSLWEMAAAIPGAVLCVIDNCGHLATLEQPDAVNAALSRWLHAA
jgi:pimeloyl-ACP methyl ester carboxylesterase